MKVDDHGWLVGANGEPVVKRFPTVRTYALATPAPLGIVWHREDPGPIWKQTVLPRVLDQVFGGVIAAVATTGTAGQGVSL